jgi:hypothetical protein
MSLEECGARNHGAYGSMLMPQLLFITPWHCITVLVLMRMNGCIYNIYNYRRQLNTSSAQISIASVWKKVKRMKYGNVWWLLGCLLKIAVAAASISTVDT